MRWMFAFVVLAGCTPVAWKTNTRDIAFATPTLQREGSAVVRADKVSDPEGDARAEDAEERIQFDQSVRVKLASGVPRAMTIEQLVADCPSNLEATDANVRAYPKCTLFHVSDVELRRGRRVNKTSLAIAGVATATAGALACASQCSQPVAEVALGTAGIAAASGVIGLFVHELFKDVSLKH
ncbi:MAG: hypothetical protein QM831_15255 [Kofleriaceae bacterium]